MNNASFVIESFEAAVDCGSEVARLSHCTQVLALEGPSMDPTGQLRTQLLFPSQLSLAMRQQTAE